MSEQEGAGGAPGGAPSGAAKEKMRAAAAGVGGVVKSLASTFGLDLKRASVADLTRVHATDAERAAQVTQTPPVTDARAQDHFAWRLSTLRLSIWLLAASFVVTLVDTIVELASYEPSEGVRGWVLYMPGLAKLAAAGYLVFEVVRALAGGVQRPGRAMRQLRRGWAVALIAPLLALLIPWVNLMWTVDQAQINADPQTRFVVELMRLVLLVGVIVEALPALLSVFPGLFRAGLTMKTLVPTRSLGPVAAASAGPFNALYLIVLLVIAQGLMGSWALPFVALFLLGAPLLTGWHCAALAKPMDASRASAGVRRVRTLSRICLGIGAIGFLLILSNTSVMGMAVFGVEKTELFGTPVDPMLGPLDLVKLAVHLAGVMLVFTVVSSDALFRLSPIGDAGTSELAADAATMRQVQAALLGKADPRDTFA